MNVLRLDLPLSAAAALRLDQMARRADRDTTDYAARLLEEALLARSLHLPIGVIVGVDKEPADQLAAEHVDDAPAVAEAAKLTGAELRAVQGLKAAGNNPSQIAARLRLPYQAVRKGLGL